MHSAAGSSEKEANLIKRGLNKVLLYCNALNTAEPYLKEEQTHTELISKQAGTGRVFSKVSEALMISSSLISENIHLNVMLKCLT